MVNKVVVNGETLLDLTGDTITSSDLAKGVIAHDASGNQIIGSAVPGYLKIKPTILKAPTAISFIDDDCRKEAYTVLWPIIKAQNIPYGLACATGQIGNTNFMTYDQLLSMANYGCDILCHHYKEGSMTAFNSAADYEKDIQKCLTDFADLGISNVKGVVYPNGYTVDDYMPVVRKYFDMGFTIERGINELPLESCYIKRCEVFTKSGIYTLADAKKLVDDVSTNGGWLVFMTHVWYETFNADELTALINYIKEKGIDIVSPNYGIENFGNIIDIGYAKKPFIAMSKPYYIVDCLGRVYANTWNYTEMSNVVRTEVDLPYHAGYTLTTSGTTKKQNDVKRIVSDKITASSGEKYIFCNLSAKYGNCYYVIYNSSNAVLAYKNVGVNSTGEVLDEVTVTMPENTSYFRLACDLLVNDVMFKAYKIIQ